VITNERQYRITRNWLERFEHAHAEVEGQNGTLHPRAQQALRDQYDSQIEELRAELAEYEALRRGDVAVLELDSLAELPAALIRARTASGLSQEALAGRLGLKKQQVQRYETTRYAGVSLARLQAVVAALGVTIREQLVLPVATSEFGTAPLGPEPAPGSVSLAGTLTRAGLTLDDLATRLSLPSSVALKLQRGRIDPETVPERLLAGLATELGTTSEEALRLIASHGPASLPAHARASTRRGRSTRATDAAEPISRMNVSFRDALANASDLTDEHRHVWLEVT